MKYRTAVRVRPRFIVCFDPGVKHTGYSVFRHGLSSGKFIRTLSSFGKISPGESFSDELLARACYISSHAKSICDSVEASAVYVEQPLVVYGGRLSKQMILAKASSVFKTIAVAYHISASTQGRKVKSGVIYPNQWEPSKKARAGQEIKAWSLDKANEVIQEFYSKPHHLCTGPDENIADAINIGMKVLDRLENGEE